ncbi:DUF2948 family protein [Rhodovulum bhavnagarense]|uniref:DUF2948 family protein n=1 Tax=Rhodovulum bhavnagarense TaxID=992286 RepID=A0A4R2RC79_9RHOB|nr:DUF2948 family protein [Rhodovulum bhavnagarense]TCP59848.1 DUF2948 family protein [Rhodovulum bhavnagarense]
MSDARFEDGAERPLRLMAVTQEDLQVLSALVQDAVLSASDMRWDRGRRRFALLLNRFRWEDCPAAERLGRPYERVRSVLTVEDVQKVASQGFDRDDADQVLSVLSVAFEPGAEGSGRVVVTLAGDGALAFDVECLEIGLHDVTRPYAAPSGKVPRHP